MDARRNALGAYVETLDPLGMAMLNDGVIEMDGKLRAAYLKLKYAEHRSGWVTGKMESQALKEEEEAWGEFVAALKASLSDSSSKA